jgi:hypothetical protein
MRPGSLPDPGASSTLRYHSGSRMRRPPTGVLSARREALPSLESVDELRLRLVAVPVALVIAALFSRSGMGHALQRMFFGMPLHELGHALTALALGFPAFPLPWFTPMAASRSPVLVGLLLGVATGLVVLGRSSGRRGWMVGGAVLGAVVLLGLLPETRTARALISFAGDAGALVLGTAFMCTVFSGEESPFRRGALRWGLLVIGAAAFSDVASVWWAAQRDPGEIPLGEIEGAGLSDASVLVETYRWTEQVLVSRYLTVVGLCLAVLAVVWTLRALRPLLLARD